MARRLYERFKTDEDFGSLPRRNMLYDLTQKEMQLNRKGIGPGLAGAVWRKSRQVDSNIGASPVVCSTTVGYTHWLSGGEFTLPYPGLSSIIYSDNGLQGSILGYMPKSGAKSYYRLSYATPDAPDIPAVDDYTFGENKGGYPVDTLPGDQGYMNLEGYGYGMLASGPVFMRANPFCAIEMFDTTDKLRMSSFNFVHYTSGGEDKRLINEKKAICNETKLFSTKFSPHTAKEGGIYEPKFPYMTFLGSLGNVRTEHLKSSYHKMVHTDGTEYGKSSTGFIWSVGRIPTIIDTIPKYDPEKPYSESDDAENKKGFEWADGPRLSQELFYLSNAYTKYFSRFKTDITEKDKVIEPKDSVIHTRDDGSIMLMAKGGASIELSADGDITISPQRHLKIQAGGTVAILAGGELNQVCKNDCTIRSTDKSISIIGRKNTQIYGRDGVSVEGEGRDGISLYAKTAAVTSSGIDISHTANRYLVNKSGVEHNECEWSQSNKKYIMNKYKNKQEEGEQYTANLSSTFSIKSDYLIWAGKRFQLNGSESGIINATKPIRINHEHKQGRGGSGDKFTFAACGLGCRVRTITTPPLGLQDVEQSTLGFTKVEKPEVKDIDLSNEPDKSLVYSYAPWQLSSTSYWATITQEIKSQKLFPTKNDLKTFTGNDFVSIPWQAYSL